MEGACILSVLLSFVTAVKDGFGGVSGVNDMVNLSLNLV
jgi:hypothetical protein